MTCLSIGSLAHRAARGLLTALAVGLLSACGSSVVSDLKPTRFMSVGDSFLDVGQDGALYTVNDGTANWIQQLTAQMASHYGVNVQLKPVVDGGWGYAEGYARVATPDTSSGKNSPSVKDQVDALLAATTLGKNDVIFVNGGMHDIVAAAAPGGGGQAAAEAAASALVQQVSRLVANGAQHVLVMGIYDLGNRPGPVIDSNLANLSLSFNTRLRIELSVFSGPTPLKVLFFDPSVFFNDVYAGTLGVGAGTNRLVACPPADLLTCTGTNAIANYNDYLFADNLHLTPLIQRRFVDEGYSFSEAYNPFLVIKGNW